MPTSTRSVLAFGDAHRDVAQHAADLALEIAHAGLSGVAGDDRGEGAIVDARLFAVRPFASSWRRTR